MNGRPDRGKSGLDQLIAHARNQVEESLRPPGPTSDAIPGYELRGEIHRGGQGVVYLAHQQATQRDVAIKVMREGPFAGPGDRARFEREVQLLASLKHPNIVAIHDSGSVSGNFFFVMDFIPGLAFDEWCDRTRPGSDDETTRRSFGLTKRARYSKMLRTFIKICHALKLAHQRGIIHRDLKPTNIRVDEDDEPFVLDFGLAKVASADADTRKGTDLTETGQFLGTLSWASPEQVAGTTFYADIRSDVYALGLMLFRALTGSMPYAVGKNFAETVRVITEVDPARPRSLVSDVDHDMETIVLKCLSKDPDRRYQTAGELAEDLQRYLDGEPIDARRESGWYMLQMFARRHRMAVTFVMAFATLLVGSSVLLTVLYSRARQSEELALRRADETRRVAEFQASQLANIDPALMGMRMRKRLLDGFKNASSADPTDPRSANFEVMLANVNFTDLAKQVLDENIFETALQAIDSQFHEQPLVRAELLQTLAVTLKSLGLYERASAPQTKALAIRRSHLGHEHPATLNSMNNTGQLLQAMGQTEAALPYLREALENRRRILGDQHPETLTSIHNMGDLLQTMERFEDASIYVREALDTRRNVLGNEHTDTLSSVNNWGSLLYQTGRLKEALPFFREALDGYRGLLGDEHPETLASINNMGFLLRQMGRFDEALVYFREALQTRRRVLGNDHPNTLNSMNNLAGCLQALGQLDEAIALSDEAVDGYRRVLGNEHPHTLRAIRGKGNLLILMGRLQEAEPFVNEALVGQRRVLGNDHSETIVSVSNMALLLQRMGQSEDAMPYARESLEANRRIWGDEHPRTITATRRMGNLLKSMRHFEDAMPYVRKALDASRGRWGDEHPDTLALIFEMGSLLKSSGSLDEAEVFYRQALDGFTKVLGEEHPNTLSVMVSLGSLFKAREQLEEALPYYRKGLAGYRLALGDEHPFTLRSITLLGELYLALGQLEQAQTYFDEALENSRRALGDNHPETVRAMRNMGSLLASTERLEEAERLLLEAAEGAQQLSAADELRDSVAENLVNLYEARHAAQPNAGFDERAAKWRETLGMAKPDAGSTP